MQRCFRFGNDWELVIIFNNSFLLNNNISKTCTYSNSSCVQFLIIYTQHLSPRCSHTYFALPSMDQQYIVSARKYRPTTFDSVVGQKHVAETLMYEIESNKLAQAFLFTGPRGVGKTTCARILAKVINSRDGQVDPNQDFAFNIFELDAASNNGVDDIRNLIEQVRIPPQVGKYKVYIIDEVHMLTQAAFNAFLKTLEEPPSYAIFILATTEKHKVLPTILSRCQVFHFNRIETSDMVTHLKEIAEKEGIKADEDALHLIARKADGGCVTLCPCLIKW